MSKLGFERVDIRYAPGTHGSDRYRPGQERAFSAYLSSIVIPTEMQTRLRSDFVQVDGALHIRSGEPATVADVMVNPSGRESFIHVFRNMVNQRVKPAPGIPVTGVWIPEKHYRELETEVDLAMGDVGADIDGMLIGAAAVEFPYLLRPQSEGGEPLDFPPPFYEPLGINPGDEPFSPISATGNPSEDCHTVRVIQAVYGDGNLVTGRVGLVWGALNDETVRTVPEEIAREVLAHRGDEVYPALSALAVSQHIVNPMTHPAAV
jgi:hypothetical protein